MKADPKILQDLLGDPTRVISGHGQIAPRYQQDALGRLNGNAEALVFVASTDEVSAILRYAYDHHIPVTPRGAGTNLVGSTVPLKGGIILDLSPMNRILELDADTFTVTVEPGVLLQDLQAYVEQLGWFYPPDPGEKASTIGGNISTNAGGMRAVKYGVTRDYVYGLELVLADGTILSAGSKNRKDVSGLSLKSLIIGSEGTLAVITKCILKLLPKPEISQSVLIPYPNLQTGMDNTHAILHANANPTAIEFIERSVVQLGEEFLGIRYPCPEAGSYILLTFDGRKTEVDYQVSRIRELALVNGALDYIILSDPAYAADIWKVRGALVKAVEAASEQEPVDIVVPINQTVTFIEYMSQLEQESGVRMVRFGHAGDGNVHLCVMREGRDESVWKPLLKQTLELVYAKAHELGGLPSGEHGIGLSKRHYFLRETDPANLLAMNRIKNALDERHILNDRKSYTTGGELGAETV